jgi:secernin
MCDTAVVVGPGRVLFAKNSDRDPNEAQILEWHPRAHHAPGAAVRCTWIDVPQARETAAILISRPFWMWGAEMGANEHGVVIGNEAVFTREPLEDRGLTGMDMLRLALERARNAEEAVATITALLERHGQGGGCGHEDRTFSYSSSFLVADPGGAFVLETAGRRWAAEAVRGPRAISNALTLQPFASRYEDRARTRISRAHERRTCTTERARRATGAADMMSLLRDHGEGGDAPSYTWTSGALGAPCVHAGGLLAGPQTTASWVSELSRLETRHWVTATAAPCTGLFKPVRVTEPVALGPAPDDRADGESLWWRHERLHRRVMCDPARLLPLYRRERDDLETRWRSAPPEPAKAFAEADRRLREWTRRVAATAGPDRRPALVRRLWRVRNERTGLALDAEV